jgi:hypothetical protein
MSELKTPHGVLTVAEPLTQAQADALQAEAEKFFADDPADGTYTVAGVEVTYRGLDRG